MYIEGYEHKVITLNNVSMEGKRRFIDEIVQAVKDGFEYSNTHEIVPKGVEFNHVITAPRLHGKARVFLYKKLQEKKQEYFTAKKPVGRPKGKTE